MAMDDGLIAVFDAKYTYNFWRPVTAIRNAEGNARDPGWLPFIDTPMHPEYPCAHCIVSGVARRRAAAEIGTGPTPKLSSASSTAGGRRAHVEQRRRLRAGGRGGAYLRRRALSQLDGGRHRDGQEGRRAHGPEHPPDDALKCPPALDGGGRPA
jgi:hypothetical protein